MKRWNDIGLKKIALEVKHRLEWHGYGLAVLFSQSALLGIEESLVNLWICYWEEGRFCGYFIGNLIHNESCPRMVHEYPSISQHTDLRSSEKSNQALCFQYSKVQYRPGSWACLPLPHHHHHSPTDRSAQWSETLERRPHRYGTQVTQNSFFKLLYERPLFKQ